MGTNDQLNSITGAGDLWSAISAISAASAVVITLIYGGAALVNWVLTTRRNRRRRQAQHTLEILALSFSDPVLQRAASTVNDMLIALRRNETPPKIDDLDARTLLSYYHYITVSAQYDVLDLKVVVTQKGLAIKRAVEVLRTWISAQQSALGEERYLLYLEWFIERFIDPEFKRISSEKPPRTHIFYGA